MESLRNAVVRVHGNMQVDKQLLPLSKDILNNNNAPIKFIIQLISEEVDTLWLCGVQRIVTFHACVLRMSGCAWEIQMGYVDTSRSLWCRYTDCPPLQRHRNIIIMTSSGNTAKVSLQPTHNTDGLHKKMVVVKSRTETLINYKLNV